MSQQTIQPWQYWLGLGFCGLITIGGAAMVVFGVSFLQEAFASKSWPVTEGKINAVQIIRESRGKNNVTTHHIMISYGYTVEGTPYTSDHYSLGDGSTASKQFRERSEAIAEKAKYPIGNSIKIYYKPTEPSSAVLKPGVNFGTWVPLVLGLVFVPSGLACGFAMLKNSAP